MGKKLAKHKYAFVSYVGDGAYYYFPLDSKTLDEAINSSLEYIHSGDFGVSIYDGYCEIIEVADTHTFNTNDYKDFFKRKNEEDKLHQKEQQDSFDKEQFERLKKKFGDGTNG